MPNERFPENKSKREIPKAVVEMLKEKEMDKDIPIQLSELKKICYENGLEKLFDELCIYSLDYVKDIWILQSKIEKGYSRDNEGEREDIQNADNSRSKLHTALNDQINIVVRNLRKKGVDVSWSNKLLNMGTGEISRVSSGKFGLQIAYQIVKETYSLYTKPDIDNEKDGGHL
jgi:hypothetical protein